MTKGGHKQKKYLYQDSDSGDSDDSMDKFKSGKLSKTNPIFGALPEDICRFNWEYGCSLGL